MRIGITGVEGLLGWHTRCFLHTRPDVVVVGADRQTFANVTGLDDFVRQCDWIIHLAGMNRGDDNEIYATNVQLTEMLVSACERGKVVPHIVFSSSAHIARDTPYARSKRRCAEILEAWSRASGGMFTNLVIPNVFGEGGKPFYNSVVSTFCHQLANHETPRIIQDTTNELIHAQHVASEMCSVLTQGEVGEKWLKGHALSVSLLLEKLSGFKNQYEHQIVPDLRNPFNLSLFNTYRSYLFPHRYPFRPTLHADARGRLFEAVKGHTGGQCFISTTRSGITRGNHYHLRKVERFCVIQGEAIIRIRKLFGSAILEFPVSGKEPQFIDMPTMHTHNITNVGSGELITLFWSNEIFDPQDPDTYSEQVQGG